MALLPLCEAVGAAFGPAAAAVPAQGFGSGCSERAAEGGEDQGGEDGSTGCPAVLVEQGSSAQADPARDTGKLFSAAAAALRAHNVAEAVEHYRGIVEISPQDSVALMYLAGWATFLSEQGVGSEEDVARYKNQLEAVDPARGADLDRMIGAIHDQTSAQLTEEVPGPEALRGASTTIVALGAGLHPDGTMPQVLVDRLQKTLEAAQADPAASVIVTGGKPQNGVAEADAMADWLSEQGVDRSRIHKEDRSASTVQNALFSAAILQTLRPSRIVVVTSANHVRRAGALLEIAAEAVLDPGFAVTSVASVDGPYDEEADPADWELRAIYRDCFSVVRPGM